MRLTQLFLTCCLLISTLVIAQEESSSAVSSVISKIPGAIIGDTIKIDKEVDIETKDICINIGKVDIEIDKEVKKIPINGVAVAGDSVEAAQQTNLVVPNKLEIDKEIDIKKKDVIVNICKVKIDIEKEKKKKIGSIAGANAEDAEIGEEAQVAAAIPQLFIPNKINIDKNIDIEKKNIIVNIGKVKVEIEKNKKKPMWPWPAAQPAWKPKPKLIKKATTIYPSYEAPNHSNEPLEQGDATDAPSAEEETTPTSPAEAEAEAEPEAEPEAEEEPEAAEEEDGTPLPTLEDAPSSSEEDDPSEVEIIPGASADGDGDGPASAEDTSDDDLGFDESLLFEEFTPADEPDLADEVVLGENATAVTVQGGEKFDERGVLILTGPQMFSVTFKIVKQKEKVITITGSDFNITASDFNVTDFKPKKKREAVTFIIRGRGFVPGGGLLFNEIDHVVGGHSKGGLFEFLEPRVFLGAIPLKVVKFTDTVIIARFLDIEDQRSFEGGTHLARVKVLHVDLKKEKKKHGPGGDIGILGHDDEQTEIVSVGGLVLPALGAIGSSITSGPVLGVIGGDNKKKNDFSHSLLGLFSGLRFDTAVLAVQFSVKDAEKIKGSYSTLFPDGYGLDM